MLSNKEEKIVKEIESLLVNFSDSSLIKIFGKLLLDVGHGIAFRDGILKRTDQAITFDEARKLYAREPSLASALIDLGYTLLVEWTNKRSNHE